MHLAEVYSREAGLKLTKPELYESFYPISLDKPYIVFTNGSGMPSKNYDYMQDVLGGLRDLLGDKYNFILVGTDKDKPINNVIDLRNKTNFSQLCFVLKNAALLISNDTAAVHIAGIYNIPIVALYSVNFSNNCRPFWYNENKTVLLESHRNGYKPSFSAEERPKTINFIKVEEVVNSALNLLGEQYKYNNKTFWIGENYHEVIYEFLPDHIINPEVSRFNKNIIFNARLDYYHNEQILAQNLQFHKCSIILNKKINLDILKHFKSNINGVFVEITDNTEYIFIQDLIKIGVPVAFFSYLPDDKIKDWQFKFIDIGVIHDKKVFLPKELENLNDLLDSNDIWFKTNRYILSENKLYFNYVDLINKENFVSTFEQKSLKLTKNYLNNIEFIKDINYFYFYEHSKIEKNTK